ncbi:phosphoenolpyruvate--protein phosphotransferase [Pseudoalteromonas ruthenica]|uniref:phosphoenolpyruvate--protein phosphotransferase n=1 Tax=Pseudoalteromonas ruthenica TaxID=151081 RepID=A0A0F4PWP3_9GAMM|nr:phosphoenolpyruvate--protein phosphotransferase [Pseudoalteromonas ruthenica]KJY97192.1 signal peptide protein [Pseudoalteromonas ruthenica]KJY99504.1 signal peptide protein [Pseudoalteromonas ruthenica]TMO93415.1 phosphoenolpyruvate-protein phosphotransferase PtsP [Pseudoalteromonas ruthenica]TMO96489.1 phosphoenolpyruvate-protein phosphotransferase PtsP [Pseudoalteromonas ruthenica]TMP04224.1 phosphoenolpyruvate-protein phosphotransferase PtsP [Pseudoalteromonas ruthenica]
MLATMRTIVEQVAQQPSLESALVVFVSQVKKAMRTECCSIYFADYSKDNFVLMATDGLNPGAVGQFRVGFTEGLVGLVAQREEPINLAYAKSHPRFVTSDLVQEDQYNAFLSVPIVHQRRVLGVIVVQQQAARVFSEDEESFLITLSAQLAPQLADAQLQTLLNQDGQSQRSTTLKGISGSPGIALGQAYVVLPKVDFSSVEMRKEPNKLKQKQLFFQAVAATHKEFSTLAASMQGHLPDEAVAVFEVYLQLLDAKSLGRDVELEIADGWCAKSALKRVIERLVQQFNAMQDPYIKERAVDVKDIGLRVLHHLLNTEKATKVYPDDTILVAHTLTPAMLAQVPKEKLKGVVSVHGAANSHASILTKAMSIPTVWGINDIPLLQFDQKELIVDAYAGRVYLCPSEALKQEYAQVQHHDAKLHDQFESEHHLEAKTADGKSIDLLLNAGLDLGSELNSARYCDGVGLYRTESWFMQKGTFPSQHEQEVWYRQVLSSYHPAPVTMRTLDIGGDKALDYFDIDEENPFLGWRGIRVSLDHPELFLDQLKAMIKANTGLGNLRIMLPMISDIGEVDDASALMERAYYELQQDAPDQFSYIDKPLVGVMIEVPSSMYLLKELAAKVDFCSVGSNDLTQYLLAVDRANSRVAGLFDPYHPAVLRALNSIAQQCQNANFPFSLCGELAGEPEGAVLLIAMGFDSLSMNFSSLHKVKWVIRRVGLAACEVLLHQCLAASSAKKVHRLVREFMLENHLGALLYTQKE